MLKNMKALAADIDMTLTNKGSALPQITKDAFEILHRNGVLLGLATGREIVDPLKHQGETWGLSFEFDFLIGMNGGMIYDHKTDVLHPAELLKREEMKDILTYMKPLIDRYQISVNAEGGSNHNAMNIQGDLLASAKRHGFMFEDKTGDIDGFCEKAANKMLFRTLPEYEQEIRDTFLSKYSDRFQIFGTFPGTVEIMYKGIDKGSGMRKYAAEHQIPMNEIIAFGDNENDNTLLCECGWGVALCDGVEKTREIADDITEYPCAEGGVGHYLFDHWITPNKIR